MVSLISIWFYPSVENFISGNRMWNGVKIFVEAFEAREINSLEELPAVPESTALVAIPYLEYSQTSLSLIKEYLNNGATVLLMDDYGYGNTLLNYLNLEEGFTGDVLLDPLFNYKNPYLPRITDFSPALNSGEVAVVLFNHATSLRDVPEMNGHPPRASLIVITTTRGIPMSLPDRSPSLRRLVLAEDGCCSYRTPVPSSIRWSTGTTILLLSASC